MAGHAAFAQCNRWSTSYGAVGGIIDNVNGNERGYAITTWDPDGSGPLLPQLILGGEFDYNDGVAYYNVARWDGVQWHPLASGLNAGVNQPEVNALTTWDPDGPGPSPALLVLAGYFAFGGNTSNVVLWDGTQYSPLGTGLIAGDAFTILALLTFDFDGDGPLLPELVVAGRFSTADNTTVNGIARWNGTRWLGLGSGMLHSGNQPGTVYSLAAWDQDGPGPLSPTLAAAGYFQTADGNTVNHVATWDGATWQPLGTGLTSSFTDDFAHALASWDPDGDGPSPPLLVVGGSITSAGGVPVANLAAWNGTAWSPIGSGSASRVDSMTTWDPDGSGPLRARLVVNAFQMWDGSSWLPMDQGAGGARSYVMWDSDGPGPAPERLYAATDAETAGGGVRTNYVAQWDGAHWLPLDTGLNGAVNATTLWDPDGAGPQGKQVVAGGLFFAGSGERIDKVARWDGTRWQPFGSGLNGQVTAVGTWDPDGDGPLAAKVVAGGTIPSTREGLSTSGISIWNDGIWGALGGGMSGQVLTLGSWDPDGIGPASPFLVAGGNFFLAGGQVANSISLWDGAAWRSLNGGVAGGARLVNAVLSWDPDGNGPQTPQLVIGGNFLTAGGVTTNRIAAWNGTNWLPFGTGMNQQVSALCLWDPDGNGPQPARLVAGGAFTSAGGMPASKIATWNGAQWQPLGVGLGGEVKALAVMDPDGEGIELPTLVAAGLMGASGTTPINHISRWNGTAWVPLSTGINGTFDISAFVYSLTIDPEPLGPPAIVAGGNFTYADGQRVGYITKIQLGEAPNMSQQPADQRGCRTNDTQLTVAAGGPSPIQTSWEWRRSEMGTWRPVGDGDNIAQSGEVAFVAAQADSPSIRISPRSGVDRLLFRAVFANSCGSTTSEQAEVLVCVADTDDGSGTGQCDGGVTIDDLLYYLLTFEGGDVRADVDDGNASGTPDGGVTIDDLLYYLARFELGC